MEVWQPRVWYKHDRAIRNLGLDVSKGVQWVQAGVDRAHLARASDTSAGRLREPVAQKGGSRQMATPAPSQGIGQLAICRIGLLVP